MQERGAGCIQRLGVFACPPCILEGFFPFARFVEVIREVAYRVAVLIFKRNRNGAVKRFSFQSEDVLVYRFAGERVTEQECLRRFFHDQLGADQFAEAFGQFCGRLIRQRLKQINVETATDHRRQFCESFRFGTEAAQAVLNRKLYRARHAQLIESDVFPFAAALEEIARFDQRLERLLQKERITLRQAVQASNRS